MKPLIKFKGEPIKVIFTAGIRVCAATPDLTVFQEGCSFLPQVYEG